MLAFTLTEKVLAGLLVASVLVGGSYGLWQHHKATAVSTAQAVAVEKQATVKAQAEAQYTDAVATAKAKQAAQSQTFKETLDANPSLSSTPVPDAVFDGLRDAQRSPAP